MICPITRRVIRLRLFLTVLAAPPAALLLGAPLGCPAHAQAVAAEATAPIQALYGTLQKAQDLPSAAGRAVLVAPAVGKAFNMDTLLRRSIGLHYNQLTPQERSQLVQAFQHFTVARYVSSFTPKSKAVFAVQPATQPSPTGGVIVSTTLRGIDDSPDSATPVNYVMSQTPKGWRIDDILMNGHISQTATQRSDFRSILDKKGASGLSQTLNQKADGLLHG